MQSAFFHFAIRLRLLIKQQSGQDLVEYALVVALIALGATIGMKQLAGGIDKAFNSVSNALATDI
jgi:pilus assembly protein Flp/PilA